MKLTRDIQGRAAELEHELYSHKKKLGKLARQYKK